MAITTAVSAISSFAYDISHPNLWINSLLYVVADFTYNSLLPHQAMTE